MESHLCVSCLEYKSSFICPNIASFLAWRMNLEQTSDPGHAMKYKEKVPRDFQERLSLR